MGDPIYVTGESFPRNTELKIYMISHPSIRLSNSTTLTDVRKEGVTTVSTDNNGAISPTLLSSKASSDGEFNVVVDINGNERLDLAQDRIDRVGIGFAIF